MQRTLKEGMSGEDVRTLQRLLNYHLAGTGAAPLTPDGSFGHQTAMAVVRAQNLAKLVPDGIVGQKTRAALVNIVSVAGQVAMTNEDLGARAGSSSLARLIKAARQRSSIALPAQAGGMVAAGNPDPPPPANPPVINIQSVVVGKGQQWAWNPWAPAPSC